jgi:isopenicillin N synthase-like dioxygenase
MEHWTAGALEAPIHRVVNRAACERYSAAFFRGNAFDTVVTPLLPEAGARPRPSGSVIADDVLDKYRAAGRPVRVNSLFRNFDTVFALDEAGAGAAPPPAAAAAY